MGEHFAAIVKAVQDRLAASTQSDNGRNGRHHMGACPRCRIIVCLTHHNH